MKIKEMRLAAGLTQQDVADRMGVDRSTVSYWETNTSYPRGEQIPKLADIFGCTIDALYGRDTA
nr:MAG TPA: Repressor protein CI [Caudoviricetes sp.]